MLTVLDMAKLSSAVYQEDPKSEGWRRIKFIAASHVLNGFQAAAFSGPGGIVVAFRGTAQAEDWAVNSAYAVGMNTARFASAEDFTIRAAKEFASSFPDSNHNVYLTGHSLGGAIAQIVGNRQGHKFVTFNAPGVAVLASRNIKELTVTASTGLLKLQIVGMAVSAVVDPHQTYRDLRVLFRRVKGLNVCLNADLVSRIGVHYGDVVRIQGPSSSPRTAHTIVSVLSALEGDPKLNLSANPLSSRRVDDLVVQ